MTALTKDARNGYLLLSPTMAVLLSRWRRRSRFFSCIASGPRMGLCSTRVRPWPNTPTVLTREGYRVLFLRSIGISSLVTLVTVALAYPMAYFVAFRVTRAKFIWLLLLTIPFWTSYLLRVFAWKVILGYNGVINSGLISLGLISQPLEFLLYNPTAVVVTLAHAYAAFAILPIYVSLEKIDRSLLEAAADLGDGPLRRFLRITLPLSLPGVIGAAVLIFVPTTGDYVTPTLVGGTDGVMIANIIQVQFGRVNNWPLGAALAIASMAAVAAIAVFVIQAARLSRGANPMMMRDRAARRPRTGLAIYAFAYLAFLYVPVLLLPLFSFNDSLFIAFPLTGFTTKWYAAMAQDADMRAALANTLKVGAAASLLSTVLGLLAAKALTRRLPGRALPPRLRQAAAVHSRHRARHRASDPGDWPFHSAFADERRHRPCADLPALRHRGSDVALRRLRHQPGRSLARSRRERLDDVLARDLSAGAARHRGEPAAHLHRLVRRFPDRLLPLRHGHDVAGLYLGPAALPRTPADGAGAGRGDSGRVGRAHGIGRMGSPARRQGPKRVARLGSETWRARISSASRMCRSVSARRSRWTT